MNKSWYSYTYTDKILEYQLINTVLHGEIFVFSKINFIASKIREVDSVLKKQ